MVKSINSLVVIFALVHSAFSCSCFPTTLESHVQNAYLSVVGRAVARVDNCLNGTCDRIRDQRSGKIQFLVKVSRTVRGSTPEDDLLLASTRVNSALCGIELTMGKVYLLNLRKPFKTASSCIGTELSISSCDGVYEWNGLSREDRMYVRKESRVKIERHSRLTVRSSNKYWYLLPRPVGS